MSRSSAFPRIILLFLLAGLPSCGGSDDGPTSPGSGAFQPVLLAEATIGSAGGEINQEGVVVAIAAGEFAQDHNLALYALEDPVHQAIITGQFRLEGLPEGAQVTVSLPTSQEPTHETDLLVWDGGNHQVETATLLPATPGDGVITAVFTRPAAEDGTQKGDEDVLADFLGVSGMQTFNLPSDDEPFFRCRVPANRRAAFESALAPAVALWSDLREAGLPLLGTHMLFGDEINYGHIGAQALPLVTTSPLGLVDIEGDPMHQGPHDEDCTFKFSFEGLDPGNLTQTREMMLRSFMLRYLATIMTFETEDPDHNLWFVAACSEWAAREYLATDQYHTALNPDQVLLCLSGLYQGAHLELPPDTNDFGAGMGQFLRWTCSPTRWGRQWLAAMRGAILGDAPATPENIIMACAGQTSDQWWPAFVRDLAEGDVVELGDVPFVNAATGIWSINDEQDTQKVFNADYPDLSARIFSVRLDHDDIPESAEARFVLESGLLDAADLELMIFRRQGGELTYLTSGHEVWVGGLRQMRSSGAHLLAIVANSFFQTPYDQERSASLTVTIEEEPEGGVFEKPQVDFRIGQITENQHYEGDGCWQADGPLSTNYLFNLDGGTWTGSTYQVSYDESFTEPVQYRDQVDLTITLNGAGTVVESFHFDFTQTVYGTYSTTTEHMVVTWAGGGLPYTEGEPSYYRYAQQGTAIGDHLSGWTHTKDWSNEECQRQVTSTEAQTYSYVHVEFQN